MCCASFARRCGARPMALSCAGPWWTWRRGGRKAPMLRSVTLPGAQPVDLGSGVLGLWGERGVVPAALGYAAFDTIAPGLQGSGSVQVEIASPLDGRRYVLSRALDVAQHW